MKAYLHSVVKYSELSKGQDLQNELLSKNPPFIYWGNKLSSRTEWKNNALGFLSLPFSWLYTRHRFWAKDDFPAKIQSPPGAFSFIKGFIYQGIVKILSCVRREQTASPHFDQIPIKLYFVNVGHPNNVFSINDLPPCPCDDKAIQSTVHILFFCPFYRTERKNFIVPLLNKFSFLSYALALSIFYQLEPAFVCYALSSFLLAAIKSRKAL